MFFKVSIYHLRTLWKKKLVKVLWIVQSKNMYVLVHNQPSQPTPEKIIEWEFTHFHLHNVKVLWLRNSTQFTKPWHCVDGIHSETFFFNMYLDTFVCLKTARAWNLSKHIRGQPVFLDPVWNARTPVCP